MAPEIQTRAYDFKADIFSIGVVFYQLATMKPIKKLGNLIFEIEKDFDFVEKSLKKLKFDNTIINVISSATNMNPEKRSSADDLLKILHKSSIVLDYIKNDNFAPKVGIDHFGTIVEINQKAVSLLGFYNREEAIGYKITSIFSKSTMIYYETELSNIMKIEEEEERLKLKETVCEPRKMIIKRKHDGNQIPVHSSYYDVTCDKEKGNIRAIFFFTIIDQEINDTLDSEFIDNSLESIFEKLDEETKKFSIKTDELFEDSSKRLKSNLDEFLVIKDEYETTIQQTKTSQVQLCSSFFQMKQEESDYILEKFLTNEKYFQLFKKFLEVTKIVIISI